MIQKTAVQLFEECGTDCRLSGLKGNTEAVITGISSFSEAKKGDLVFVPDLKTLEAVQNSPAAALVVPENLAEKALAENEQNRAVFTSTLVPVAHALVKQKYYTVDPRKSGFGRIHPSAIIHESVKIPESTAVGPHAVIEQGAQIGENCTIMAHAVIEHGARLGNNVVLHPGVVLGWDCEIGDNSSVSAHTTIGAEGFGFAQDERFNHHKIPHTGNVIIGRGVTLGANNTFDRGTYGSTKIGDGCIFDNLCHVAHNAQIGKNCIIISGFLCAGSSVVGDRVVASGGTSIRDHVNICSDVYLLHRAGVVKDITKPGIYAGAPVQPLDVYTKNTAIAANLSELRQEMKELSRRFAELSAKLA